MSSVWSGTKNRLQKITAAKSVRDSHNLSVHSFVDKHQSHANVQTNVKECKSGENVEIHREALQKASADLQTVLEDSPMTREQLRQSEQQLEVISNTLRRIVKLSKQYQAAGNVFRDIALSFGQELQQFDFSNLPSTIGEQLTKATQVLGKSIIDINDYHNMFMVQLGNVFTQPMEQFIREEIKDAKETCKQHARNRIKFDQALSKFSHIKKTDVEKIPEAEHELFYIRREFQQSSLDYASKLHRAQCMSKIQLIERACAFLYCEKAFFTQGASIHQELEPKLATLSKDVVSLRRYIELQDAVLYKTKEDLRSGSSKALVKNASKTTATETAGYLFQKKGNKWKRGYYGVREGKLLKYKDVKDQKNPVSIALTNLLLTTVRPARDVERRFCFELVSPMDSFLLQAENESSLNHWISVIQNAIASALNNSAPSSLKNKNEVTEDNCSVFLLSLREQEDNRVCADCNAPDPEWVSINLGVIMCITCSGIHRQLGTHISKVRSTTLDSWDKELKKLMLALGNKFGNSVFEHNITATAKPLPDASRVDREEWIKKKYVEKRFLRPLQLLSSQTKEQALMAAVQDNDVQSVLTLIVHGVDVNWKNTKENNTAALHVAVMEGNSVMCDLLIQNGADINIPDANGWTPLHHGAYLDRVDCLILLIRRSVRLDSVDNDKKTPLDIAIKHVRAHCVTLLRLAMHAESEHPGNALEDESFAHALKEFSEEVEMMMKAEVTKPEALWTHESESDEEDEENLWKQIQSAEILSSQPTNKRYSTMVKMTARSSVSAPPGELHRKHKQ